MMGGAPCHRGAPSQCACWGGVDMDLHNYRTFQTRKPNHRPAVGAGGGGGRGVSEGFSEEVTSDCG
jgi:hypothetical protein